MNDVEAFVQRLVALEPKAVAGNSEYGSRVMPALKLYASLATSEERVAFKRALEKMLTDPHDKVRTFAIDVCLGFFVFRSVI